MKTKLFTFHVSLFVFFSLTACGGDDYQKEKPPVVVKPDPVAVAGVKVDPAREVEIGTSFTLTATVEPANATEKSVSWSSSDPSIARVDAQGNVTVVGPGQVAITVASQADGSKKAACAITAVDPDAGKEYALVWAEEFDYEGLPSDDNWIIQQQQPGWVNAELQTYVRSEKNLLVEDGLLTINLLKEGDRITSGRVESADKKSFTYGRFEIRAKLPRGKGTWPAIWALGENINHGTGWPTCGEIDIMEHVGYDQNRIVASAHTRDRNHNIGTQASGNVVVEGVSDDFHVYSVEWTRTQMTWAVDGKAYYTYKPTTYTVGDWPFNAPQFVILNVAWGGGWGGAQGVDESVLPQKMEVDYVRVYQKK